MDREEWEAHMIVLLTVLLCFTYTQTLMPRKCRLLTIDAYSVMFIVQSTI